MDGHGVESGLLVVVKPGTCAAGLLDCWTAAKYSTVQYRPEREPREMRWGRSPWFVSDSLTL